MSEIGLSLPKDTFYLDMYCLIISSPLKTCIVLVNLGIGQMQKNSIFLNSIPTEKKRNNAKYLHNYEKTV